MQDVLARRFKDVEKGFPKMPSDFSEIEVIASKALSNLQGKSSERKSIAIPLMEKGGISERCRFWGCALETYQAKNKSQKEALAAIEEYIDKRRYEKGDGLVLFGKPGTGKTHLLIAIMWECAKAGKTVKYMTAEDFFIQLRNSISGSGELDYLNTIIKPDVLVFDDLHCISEEESYQYRQLWWVLDKRYFNKKPTLTASNKSIDEFKTAFDERTRRRLCANAIPLEK